MSAFADIVSARRDNAATMLRQWLRRQEKNERSPPCIAHFARRSSEPVQFRARKPCSGRCVGGGDLRAELQTALACFGAEVVFTQASKTDRPGGASNELRTSCVQTAHNGKSHGTTKSTASRRMTSYSIVSQEQQSPKTSLPSTKPFA